LFLLKNLEYYHIWKGDRTGGVRREFREFVGFKVFGVFVVLFVFKCGLTKGRRTCMMEGKGEEWE